MRNMLRAEGLKSQDIERVLELDKAVIEMHFLQATFLMPPSDPKLKIT
jgi:hypothetical protein